MPRWIRYLLAGSIVAIVLSGAALAFVGRATESRVDRVRVSVAWPAASPQEIDEQIAAPLAAAFDPHVQTTSRPGHTDVVIALTEGTTLEDVRARVEALAGRLPADAGVPQITRAPRGAAVRFIVRGENARALPHDLARRIEAVDGVVHVDTCHDEREIEVALDRARLLQHDIDPAGVVRAIETSNERVGAGWLEQGNQEIVIRTHGGYEHASSIEEVVVSVDHGVPVHVRDVATVRDTFTRRGCRCAGSEPCATGSVFVRDDSVLARLDALLAEHGARRADVRIAIAVASTDRIDDVAASIVRRAAVPGVAIAVAEVAPPIESGGRSEDLAILLSFDRGASGVRRRVEAAIAAPGIRVLGDGAMVVDFEGDDLARAGEARALVANVLRADGCTPWPDDRQVESHHIDRALLERRGVGHEDARRALRLATDGEIAGELAAGGEMIAIRVRLDGGIDGLTLTARGGERVRWSDVVTTDFVDHVVRRCGARRCLRIFTEGSSAACARARERAEQLSLPTGVAVVWRDDG